jgi:hypothetical protein
MKKTTFIMLAMMLALSAPAQSVKDLFSRDYPVVFYWLDLTQ